MSRIGEECLRHIPFYDFAPLDHNNPVGEMSRSPTYPDWPI
jgi:hypothetical protein